MTETDPSASAAESEGSPRSLWQDLLARFRAPDAYGIVFLLILLMLGLSSSLEDAELGRTLVLLVQGGTLLFILHTSQVKRTVQRICMVAVVPGVVASLVSDLVTEGPAATLLVRLVPLLLAILAPIAIIRRVLRHPVVTVRTVMAALCVYLLVGLFYAAVFAAVAAIDHSFFAQISAPAVPHPSDFIYFSYVTLATLGYGDLTPLTHAGRMLAVSEAVLGQLYLVSIVAILIGNIGHARTHRSITGTGPEEGPDPERETGEQG